VQQKLLRIKYCTFSCNNDGLKVTPLNGVGKVTGATICTSVCLWNYSAAHFEKSPETLVTCGVQVTAYITGTIHINILRSDHSPARE
jgi:hypothetical protein